MKNSTAVLNIFLVILFLALFFDLDEYIPGFRFYSPLFLIFIIFLEMYQSKRYLKNNPTNELRLKSSNDSYFKMFPFIMGIIACTVSTIFFLIDDNERIKCVLYFIVGVMSIFNGLITIPGALIKKENNNLNFENGNQKYSVEIEQIESITVTKEDIRLNLKNDKKYFFQHLELNQTEINTSISFLKKYFDRNIEVN